MQPMETKGRGWRTPIDPDIVLSDVMMPGTSGISLLRSLQAEDSNRPVILMTGYSTGALAARRSRTARWISSRNHWIIQN